MKILVTGAAGFIGFHLIKKLIRQQHTVIGIDNFNDYYSRTLKEDRLKELGINLSIPPSSDEYFTTGNFSFQKTDISDKISLEKVFSDNHFDIVVNLAAQGGVRYSLHNPEAYISSNMNGFFNLLECVKKTKPKHFIFASSSSVYGNNEVPFCENDKTDSPVSLYAATKKANEVMAHSYSQLFNIPTTGLRFFTVYGPWGRPDMAYFSFTKSILEGKEILLFNEGNLLRDFTFIDDIVNGVSSIIESPFRTNGLQDNMFNIYNIGNNNPVKLLYFVEVLEELLHKKANIKKMPMQPGDVFSTYADISLIQKDFGFKPTTSIETGLASFVKWYRSYFNIAEKKVLN